MTTIQPNFIALSSDRSSIVGCHNLASARAYASGRLPNKVEVQGCNTYTCKAFVSPMGQFYVNINAGSQVVRMDVANAATARHYVKHGVSTETTFQAYKTDTFSNFSLNQ